MATVNTSSISSTLSFLNSLGVNAHFEQAGSAYADPAKVASALNYLGVDYVRNHYATNELGVANFNALATQGIKFDFLPVPHWTEQTVDVAAFVASLEAFEKAHPGSIAAIEGANEVNIWLISVDGVKSIASGAELQKQIFTAVQASSILKNIDVYNTTIGSTDTSLHAQLGDLSAYTDYANSHAYVMSTSNISAGLDYLVNFAKMSAPNKPVVITEAGYTTLESYWYNGVSETVQAKYTLDTLMSAFDKGIAKTYLYELYDFQSDLNLNSANSHFGLFNADGTPKLAATAIHNLTTILSDNGTVAAPPGDEAFTYSLNGMPLKGQDLLLAKQDGSIDLVVWSEPVLWSQVSKTEVVAPTTTVTVTFGSREGKVSVYDPLLGTSAISTYFDVTEIKVNVSDHPLIIEIASDLVVSFEGNNVLNGGNGNDAFYGYGGDDKLIGNEGDDTLYGGSGNDILYGGQGADKLYGGAGSDTFVYKFYNDSRTEADKLDTIEDFGTGDRINLTAVDPNIKIAGNQDFYFIGDHALTGSAGELMYTKSASSTMLYGDVNGDGKSDFAIRFDTAINFVSSDFYL